jgi:hypothetical protein
MQFVPRREPGMGTNAFTSATALDPLRLKSSLHFFLPGFADITRR